MVYITCHRHISLTIRSLSGYLYCFNINAIANIKFKRYGLTFSQIYFVVRAIVSIKSYVCIRSAIYEHNACSGCSILRKLVAQLNVLRITFLLVPRVIDSIILAHRVIHADSIKPEAILAISGLVENLTICYTNSNVIFVILEIAHRHHRYLVQRIRVLFIRGFPLASCGIIIIAIVVINNQLLGYALGLSYHIHKYRTRRIIRQADDIKPGALEGKLRRRPSGGIVLPVVHHLLGHGHLARAAHGEHGAILIRIIVAVDVRLIAKRFKGLGGIGVGVGICAGVIDRCPRCALCRAAAVGKLRKAVLVVDVRGGDDGDGVLYFAFL